MQNSAKDAETARVTRPSPRSVASAPGKVSRAAAKPPATVVAGGGVGVASAAAVIANGGTGVASGGKVASGRPPASAPVAKPPAEAQPSARTEKPQDANSEDEADLGGIPAISQMLGRVPGWLISAIVHVVLLLIMALITFAPKLVMEDVQIFSFQPDAETEPLDDAVQFESPEELERVEVEQQVVSATVEDAGAAVMADVTVKTAVDTVNVGDIGELSPAQEFAALLGANGAGMSQAGDGIGGAQFFGAVAAGQRFVFVVDNSNSMTEGRFETAIHELVTTIDSLEPEQQFYVIFYSDTAYGLFHPQTARTFVAATDRNKQLLRRWLLTVQLCLRTNCEEAMRRAVALDPDVIYLLGDGAFTDKTEDLMTGALKGKVTIHTIGMEVKPQDRRQFAAIAKANNGTFKDVGVAPGAAKMAAQHKVARNTVRGPIWGLALPLKDKK